MAPHYYQLRLDAIYLTINIRFILHLQEHVFIHVIPTPHVGAGKDGADVGHLLVLNKDGYLQVRNEDLSKSDVYIG